MTCQLLSADSDGGGPHRHGQLATNAKSNKVSIRQTTFLQRVGTRGGREGRAEKEWVSSGDEYKRSSSHQHQYTEGSQLKELYIRVNSIISSDYFCRDFVDLLGVRERQGQRQTGDLCCQQWRSAELWVIIVIRVSVRSPVCHTDRLNSSHGDLPQNPVPGSGGRKKQLSLMTSLQSSVSLEVDSC